MDQRHRRRRQVRQRRRVFERRCHGRRRRRRRHGGARQRSRQLRRSLRTDELVRRQERRGHRAGHRVVARRGDALDDDLPRVPRDLRAIGDDIGEVAAVVSESGVDPSRQIRSHREGAQRVRARDSTRDGPRGEDADSDRPGRTRDDHRPMQRVWLPRHVPRGDARPGKGEINRAGG